MVTRSTDLLGLAGVGTLAKRPVDQIQLIDLDEIVPNTKQSRTIFIDETIEDLAASIEAEGLINPITVRQIDKSLTVRQDNAQYELVAGERRWRAFKLLKAKGLQEFNKIHSLVRSVDDQSMRRRNLVENIEREDLGVLDLARTYFELKEEYGSVEDVAKAIKKSRSLIFKYTRIAEASDEIKEIIRRNNLDLRPTEVMLTLIARLKSEGKTEILAKVMDELKKEPVDSFFLRDLQARIFGIALPPTVSTLEMPAGADGGKEKKEKKNDHLWQFIKTYENRLSVGEAGLTAKEQSSLVGKVTKFFKALGAQKVEVTF